MPEEANEGKSAGQVAYEAYVRHHQKQGVSGIPLWRELASHTRSAWEAAAAAVLADATGEVPRSL